MKAADFGVTFANNFILVVDVGHTGTNIKAFGYD